MIWVRILSMGRNRTGGRRRQGPSASWRPTRRMAAPACIAPYTRQAAGMITPAGAGDSGPTAPPGSGGAPGSAIDLVAGDTGERLGGDSRGSRAVEDELITARRLGRPNVRLDGVARGVAARDRQ